MIMEEKKLYNAVQKFIPLEGGREIMIETGKLAKQADGSVVVKQGDTMLLATVVAAKDAKEGTDFMPLQVEYKEKFAAVGRIPGGFMKREGKAGDNEILVARLIDRALRPLFPADYHAEVYVTVNLISADKDIQADALAGLAASAALAVSDIPFGGPISEVRVARIGGQYCINPTFSQMSDCDLDLIVAGTIDNILIILDGDPALKGKFALNLFANRGEVLGALPWEKSAKRRLWSDTDSNGLYWYLERLWGITQRSNIDSALDIHAATHAFNEVQKYLEALMWDGVPRLDTLFIDYLGAKDTAYNRAVCRKSFTAAVARAMTPGCKYDTMLILAGPQGVGM